jgi:hypothetical protein
LLFMMSRQQFTSELARAYDRSDRAEIERHAELYHTYCETGSAQGFYDDHSEDLNAWMDLGCADPDRALASVMVAAASYDSSASLGMVAAGILEDLLREPSSEMLDRVFAEARKTARLRWMLAIVYPHAMSPIAWQKLEPLLSGVSGDDPLPAAPHP